jgi:hypothetical protein
VASGDVAGLQAGGVPTLPISHCMLVLNLPMKKEKHVSSKRNDVTMRIYLLFMF